MIQVLNIISDSNIGGAGRVLLNYARYCDRSAFHTAVALPRGSRLRPALERLDIPIYEMDGLAERSYHKDDVKALTRLIRELDPDLVHTHGALSGRIAARRCKKPAIYTKHCAFPPGRLASSPPGRLLGRLMDAYLSSGVIAIGPSTKDVLQQTGIPEGKIHVMFNGTAPLAKPEAGVRDTLRAQSGFAPEDFVVGMLARIEPYKGQTLLLEAAEHLLAQGRRIKLLFAGQGGGEEELRRRAEALPPGTVCFAGFVEQVEQALWCMDIQVNASTESETSSLSLLEGMSLGLPAVVSNVGGNPQLILDGENGLVFENRDSACLARCIARLMDSPEERTRMGQRAEEIFRENFTGEVFARNVEAVYRTVLEEKRHGT